MIIYLYYLVNVNFMLLKLIPIENPVRTFPSTVLTFITLKLYSNEQRIDCMHK